MNHKEENTFRQASQILETANGIAVLRHASKGLHQGSWRLSMGTLGEMFAVSATISAKMITDLTWCRFDFSN